MIYVDHEYSSSYQLSGRVSHISQTLTSSEALSLNESFLPLQACSEGTFCSEAEDYPRLIKDLVTRLEDNSLLRDLFSQRARAGTTSKLNPNKVSILSEDTTATISPDVDTRILPSIFSQAGLDPLLEEALCEERVDYHYPRKAQTKDEEWR